MDIENPDTVGDIDADEIPIKIRKLRFEIADSYSNWSKANNLTFKPGWFADCFLATLQKWCETKKYNDWDYDCISNEIIR